MISLRQFRFSLGSLLHLITAIVACLAVLRVQQQLVASQHFSDVAGNVLWSAVVSDASPLRASMSETSRLGVTRLLQTAEAKTLRRDEIGEALVA